MNAKMRSFVRGVMMGLASKGKMQERETVENLDNNDSQLPQENEG